ncbi:MAG: hypothetical protein J6A50_06280 [Clostridia bacterium]|nr:hypothetical protein [Clostridia bacterium]
MQYENLQELINENTSCRRYFLSQSPAVQVELHEFNDLIHSDIELHAYTCLVKKTSGVALSTGGSSCRDFL